MIQALGHVDMLIPEQAMAPIQRPLDQGHCGVIQTQACIDGAHRVH